MYSYIRPKEKVEICCDKKKILIVDDEEDVLLLFKKRLIAMGFSVIAVDNSKDALVLAESEHPDLIILDVLMPGMDGPEIAKRLKEIPETTDIPVIFLTGMFPKHEDKKQGRIVAGNVLFDKPCDIESLLIAIKKALSEKTNISS